MDTFFRSIQIIAAVSENNAIGRKGKLPWNFPADLAFFKKQTLHSAIIMGKTTFESIGRRALPNRINIVVSTTLNPADYPSVLVVRSLEEAIEQTADCPKTFVVGGVSLYKEALEKYADTVWLTRIPVKVPDADAYFPLISNDFETSAYFSLSLRQDKSLELRELVDFSYQGDSSSLIVQKFEHPARIVKSRNASVWIGD